MSVPMGEVPGLIGAELGREASPAARALTEELIRRHGEAISAVVYYGSGLRTGDEGDVVLDLLIVVDDYREFYAKRWLSFCNALLAPNVFYLETPLGAGSEERTVRCKYAVISRALLLAGTSPRTLQVYYWGRLSQPCILVHARDDASREVVESALSQAAATFVRRVLPLVDPSFDAPTLWKTGLTACYGTELRAERKGNAGKLVYHFGERCPRITRALFRDLPELGVKILDGGARFEVELTDGQRKRARWGWGLRRVQGKTLHLLRLFKGVFTFEGGVDYILWKIERHSGVRVEPSRLARRYPLLFGWGTLWKLYRLGAFR